MQEKETVTLVIVKFEEQIGVQLVVFGLDGIIKEAFTPAMTVQFCEALLTLCLGEETTHPCLDCYVFV
jgi:hypothetical protein